MLSAAATTPSNFDLIESLEILRREALQLGDLLPALAERRADHLAGHAGDRHLEAPRGAAEDKQAGPVAHAPR